ncbi:O-antigen ligase family protein [Bogoriella caseilytica]|uniref:O-antigen ligase-like membrane protein n=1 Tax=Bogoriella caseilytica TaxID=56055 RepID=A0A3N2BDK9_9MICO|nr:O-antigen ligase family protein [Bogoriella caseilytica]ROR73340.1 O-antigen ligase-like membrane protein [Bogoriella caseilytica]
MKAQPQVATRLYTPVAALLSVMLTAFLVVVLARESHTLLGALLGAVLLLVAMAVPRHVLPAAAVIIYALLPTKLLPGTAMMEALPLGTILLIVWRVRVWLDAHLSTRRTDWEPDRPRGSWGAAAAACAALFSLWALISAMAHSSTFFGLGWIVSFCAAVFVGLTVRSAPQEAALLRRTWIVVGGLAGSYAVLEFVLGGSPLFGTLYALVGETTSQHWSVYRAEVSFSHPLFAGVFLSVATVLGVLSWMERRESASLVWGLLSAAGVVATLSRGPMLATIAALIAGLVIVGLRRGERRPGQFALLAVIGLAAAVVVSRLEAFATRTGSVEAELSAGARRTGMDVALQAAASSNYLGTGPATSGQTAARFGSVVIENSYLQILISLGLPGLILLLGILAAVLVIALRARRTAAAAAAMSVVIAFAGFNALDAVRSMHLILGLVVFLALHLPADDGDDPAAGASDHHRFGPRQRRPRPSGRLTGDSGPTLRRG